MVPFRPGALKVTLGGKHQTKSYPTTDELVDFGRRVGGVAQSADVITRIADAMGKTLDEAKGDARVTSLLWEQMAQAREEGCAYAR